MFYSSLICKGPKLETTQKKYLLYDSVYKALKNAG